MTISHKISVQAKIVSLAAFAAVVLLSFAPAAEASPQLSTPKVTDKADATVTAAKTATKVSGYRRATAAERAAMNVLVYGNTRGRSPARWKNSSAWRAPATSHWVEKRNAPDGVRRGFLCRKGRHLDIDAQNPFEAMSYFPDVDLEDNFDDARGWQLTFPRINYFAPQLRPSKYQIRIYTRACR